MTAQPLTTKELESLKRKGLIGLKVGDVKRRFEACPLCLESLFEADVSVKPIARFCKNHRRKINRIPANIAFQKEGGDM